MNAVAAAGIVTLLKYPYPRHVDELSQYETVRVHVELGRSLSSSDNFTQFSVRATTRHISEPINQSISSLL